MKTLFLTSSAQKVMHKVITQFPDGYRNKTAFITTAAEGEEGDKSWLLNDRSALEKVGLQTFEYTLTNKTSEQVKNDLSNADVLFFSGGNTFYLLQQIQQSNSASVIRDFIHTGKIYVGSSAGSLIAGPNIEVAKKVDSVEHAPKLSSFKALGLVNFEVLPHWGSPEFKDLYLNQRLDHAYTSNCPFVMLNDMQYVYVKDDWVQIQEV